MQNPIRASLPAYLNTTHHLWLIALGFFALNQLLELILLFSFGQEYNNLCNWDCGWYASIAAEGYQTEAQAFAQNYQANWAFFPVFPLLVGLINWLFDINTAAVLIVPGKLFFLLAIFAVVRYVAAFESGIRPATAAAVVAFQPYAIYGNVGYTEPVFLLFTVLSLHALRQDRVVSAGIWGALLSATRLAGIAMLAGYLVHWWQTRRESDSTLPDRLLALLLFPLGLGLFMTYLYFLTGDGLAFSNVQVAWERIPDNPLNSLNRITLTAYGLSVAGSLILVLAVLLHYARDRKFVPVVFTFIATLLPLSTGLTAMPRYIWWQAPVLLAVAAWTSKGKMGILIFPLFVTGLILLYQGWFSSATWVI